MLLWILLALCVVSFLLNTREHMTNDDLLSTLKTFGEKGTKTKTKTKQTEPPEAPIYGPKAPPLEHPKPAPSNGKPGSSGVYPDIYGPEYEGVPGSPCKKSGKHGSDDDKCDDAYKFNPDLQKAFPTEGPPQPFLTDFSKIQH